ncbi:MAG: signal peptide peptidase SppA [candidate division Zixibacteria bacterium]|nr:signal peptide peptidase SppA [candidate division Zixibacteria bacterium]
MARKRDIVIAVIIGIGFLMAFGLFALMMIGAFSQTDGVEFTGLSGGNVGVIEVQGEINELSGRIWIKQLDKWAKAGSIKAIVLHVNSPGGGTAISQELHAAVRRAKENKPVVASMASVAASGGYYIACAADKIVANPSTVTGSIGVIFQFHTFKDLMGKVGIGTETIKSGEMKDVGSYSRGMTEKEELMLRSVVMDTYEQFVEAVAEGRGMEKSQVYPLADGSVFTGQQAYNLGLVDTLGGLKEAVDLAGSMAGIDEPEAVTPTTKEKVSLFDLIGGVFGAINNKLERSVESPQLMFLFQ